MINDIFIKFAILVAIVFFAACGKSTTKDQTPGERKMTSADTCENPDANINCCFVNAPEDLTGQMTIAGSSEEGERIIIKGQILKEDGVTPYPNVVIYAYHTDNAGYYSKRGDETGIQKWHGHLFGWCKTTAEGEYEIQTIKPARYPSNKYPAHIHRAIKEPNGNTTYLNDFVFSDDSLVTGEYLSGLNLPGDNGVVTLSENGEGVLEGRAVTVLK